MTRLHVTNRDGDTRDVDAPDGLSLMETLRNAGFDEIEALCGGSCACATCHVHVDPAWIDRVGRLVEGAAEAELLQFAEGANEYSRLACQIPMVEGVEGLILHVPEQQY